MFIKKKLVLVGDGYCGKTTLLCTFLNNEYPEIYVPTIYDESIKELEIDELQVTLVMSDTAGEEDYDRLRPLSYPNTDIVLICFSIDSPPSLYNARKKWAREIKHYLRHVPVILVGTKLDLRSDSEVIHELKKTNEHPVTLDEGKKAAKEINAVCYKECSALTLANVKTTFEEAVRISLNYKRPMLSRNCAVL